MKEAAEVRASTQLLAAAWLGSTTGTRVGVPDIETGDVEIAVSLLMTLHFELATACLLQVVRLRHSREETNEGSEKIRGDTANLANPLGLAKRLQRDGGSNAARPKETKNETDTLQDEA
jgi:hypothetical protein